MDNQNLEDQVQGQVQQAQQIPLNSGEVPYIPIRRHWVGIFDDLWLWLVLVTGLNLGAYILTEYLGRTGKLTDSFVNFLIILFFIYYILKIIKWKTVKYAYRPRHILVRHLFKDDVLVIGGDTKFVFKKGLWGMLWGYSTIKISDPGTPGYFILNQVIQAEELLKRVHAYPVITDNVSFPEAQSG